MKRNPTFIFLLVALLAITCCRNEDPATDEMLALRFLHDLATAESKYRTDHGKYGTLGDLGPSGARLIAPQLAGGVSNGYRFDVSTTVASYSVQAHPVQWGVTGRRSFYADESRVVRQSWTQALATLDSAPVE